MGLINHYHFNILKNLSSCWLRPETSRCVLGATVLCVVCVMNVDGAAIYNSNVLVKSRMITGS